MDRLLTEFVNLLFQRATWLGKARNCWQASSSSFQLSRSWEGASTGSELPSNYSVSKFFETDRSQRQCGALWPWKCAGSMVCWRLCFPWSCSEPIYDNGEMLSLRPSSFLAPTEGGVRNWVILLFPETGSAISKTGEAHDTISLDSKRCVWMGPVFERLQRRRQQDKPLLNLNYALLPFRPSRRKPAGGYGGHIKAATLELRWTGPKTCERWSPYKKKRGRWKSAKSVRHEKSGRVNQRWSELAPLVRHTASTATTSCPSALPHGHPSPTPPRLLRLL